MESDVLERLKTFSLSVKETNGVELDEEDVSVGIEEASRSIIGKIYGDKKANLVGVRSTIMKLWAHRALCKMLALVQNVFQFVFNEANDKEGILQGRPRLFDNQLIVLHSWTEGLYWTDACFNVSLVWIQVWHIPTH